jgi:predicted lipid-binding transport protein (Tim44 family)
MGGPMMNGPMMNGSMMLCMVASALFGLIIAVTIIVQAVLLAKILGELRKFNEQRVGNVPPE